MRETDEIQTDAPGHCRRHDRQCARVVRLCDALGYLMRPVGGALIGHIGDRFGRRAT
jgi:nitrate/nitrite transporter NarK